MSRRVPTAILSAKGAIASKPGRFASRRHEPKPSNALGKPPAHLSDEEKEVWNEIADRLPPGVAFDSDRDAFEQLVRLTHLQRTAFSEMKMAERGQLLALWGRFGLTPSDRPKVSVSTPKESALDSFISKSATADSNPSVVN